MEDLEYIYYTTEDLLNLVRENNIDLIKEIENLDSTHTLNSMIAISIQYQRFEIFKYLLTLIYYDETQFFDSKLRENLQAFKIFYYLTIKYYKNDLFLKYLVSQKIPIPSIALYKSCKNGNFEIVKYLFDNCCSVSLKSIEASTFSKNFDIVYFLLEKISSDISIIPINIIDFIFINGPFKLIEFLIKQIKINKYTIRLLFEHGRMEIIKKLIEKNELLDIGPYAIRDAYENKHFELVFFLLRQRFPVDITSDLLTKWSEELKNDGIIVNNVPYY